MANIATLVIVITSIHLTSVTIPTVFQASGALKILIISPHSYVIIHNGCYTWFRTIFWVHRILPWTIYQIFVILTPFTPAAWLCHGSLYAWCLSVPLGLFPTPIILFFFLLQ